MRVTLKDDGGYTLDQKEAFMIFWYPTDLRMHSTGAPIDYCYDVKPDDAKLFEASNKRAGPTISSFQSLLAACYGLRAARGSISLSGS